MNDFVLPADLAPVAAPSAAAPRTRRSGQDEWDPVAGLVGQHLRELRKRQRWSLEQLALASGVSRAMLGQMEQGKSVPTIKTLWRIASALDVPIASFLKPRPQGQAVLLRVAPEALRPLAPGEGHRRSLQADAGPKQVLFEELRLAPGAQHQVLMSLQPPQPPHPGCQFNLTVAEGRLRVLCADLPHGYTELTRREAVQVEASTTVNIHNPGATEALAYCVIRPLGTSADAGPSAVLAD